MSEAGGEGIAVAVDHLDAEQVAALVGRIDAEQGRLDVLVNDIWGAEHPFEWNTPLWEHDLRRGLRLLRLAIDPSDHETPRFVGRAVAALAGDPEVARWNGQSLSSGGLAQVYGLTDVDRTRPGCRRYMVEVVDADDVAAGGGVGGGAQMTCRYVAPNRAESGYNHPCSVALSTA